MVMSQYYEKIYKFRNNTHTSRTLPIEEWVSPGSVQPGNRVFLFKEKNGKLFQTGETIQYGSVVKVDNIKIFYQYFYKGKIIHKKKLFSRLSWKSNQHMDFNKSDRYIRANNILNNIKEYNERVKDINTSNIISNNHPKIFENDKLPISKSDIKMFYSNSTLLVPIYATKIQKQIRKYIVINNTKKVLRKYLNVNNDSIKDIINIISKYL
jgi:hypothetical protein